MNARQVYKHLEALSHEEFVIHGSPHLHQILEPRQAHCLAPDGEVDEEKSQCGIYATIWLSPAVISAVVRNTTGWKVDLENMRTYVNGPSVILDEGYIYVLPQKKFKRLSNVFWFIAYEPITPIEVLHIGPDILPLLPEIILPPYLKPA